MPSGISQFRVNSVSDAFISTKFTSKDSNTFEIQHSLYNLLLAIFCYGWGSANVTSQLNSP